MVVTSSKGDNGTTKLRGVNFIRCSRGFSPMGSNANFILLFFLFQPLSEQHPFHLCLVVWNPHNVQPETQRWAKHPNYRGHSMQVKMKLLVGAQHSRHLDKKTGGHFVCACVNMGCWGATEAFSVNCLRSVPAFAGCFLELNDVYWVLRSTNMFFKVSRYFYDESEFIVASLSPLRGQSFLS